MNPGNAGMEKLIPAMNKILDVCTQVGLNLELDFPQIAVVGSQSAGKSSVLENFVGRDFLPRGSDIVTRRPLILQLISGPEEYGVFMHDESKTHFTNFDDVRKEIEAATEKVAGKNGGISPEPINLHIYSPNVLNLTLIDLPGITKVSVGHQDPDIEEKVRAMILHYISKENCLILAVTPANSDLANSDALKLAKEVDPEGIRTIGVLTKLDIMDPGTDARDILENRKVPLRRGYIGIVNRSQKHINEKKKLSEALQAERVFFVNNKHYRHLADRMGSSYLQRVLNQQLTDHIREKLPFLQDEFNKTLASMGKYVEEIKVLKSHDPDNMKSLLQGIIKEMQSEFEKEIGGLGSEKIRSDRLTPGALICEHFHERLPNDILRFGLDRESKYGEISKAIKNIYGYRATLFDPYMVFENLVKNEIERLKVPVLSCIELVVDELTSAVRISTQHMSKYPTLRENIENSVISFIHNDGPIYKKSILSLIEMELAYMNIKHEEFRKNGQSPSGNISSNSNVAGVNRHHQNEQNPFDDDDESTYSSESESKENQGDASVIAIYDSIDSYMRIVRKTTRDMVPKAITLYIIRKLQDYINDKLLVDFLGLSNDEYLNLFALSPEEAEKHEKNTKTYAACKAALEIIRTVSKETAHGVTATPATASRGTADDDVVITNGN